MKILLVLSALAAIATAGPALPDDITDFEVTKVVKRSPTLDLHSHHSHIAAPIHPLPVVHHTYVQPVIPHHLGLKKPLIFNKHHGHHLYRANDEQVENHSEESKESKNKCMKEMTAKCDDDFTAKSAEFMEGTKIEDADETISESDVVQSLQLAKEAVNTLQRTLHKAEKSRMTQWKQGEIESDDKLHENVEMAKQALDHMKLNFGNLESMNVQATTFKDAEVHDVHLELAKSDQERLVQWKDAIENIQKNVELARNIEDSFQHSENSEMKSATFEKSSALEQVKSEDQKPSLDDISLKEKSSNKHESEIKLVGKITEHEKSSNIKNDMESSATSVSESKTTLHTTNAHHEKSSKSEGSELHSSHQIKHTNKEVLQQVNSDVNSKSHDLAAISNVEQIKHDHDIIIKPTENQTIMKITEQKNIAQPMKLALPSIKTMKSSESVDMKLTHLEQEKSVPIVDTTTLMKSSDQHSQAELISNTEKQAHNEHIESMSHMEHGRSSQLDSSKASKSLDISSSSSIQDNSAQHSMMMKSSDQMAGQSHQSEVAVKMQHVLPGHRLDHVSSFGAHGKSVEGDTSSLQTSHTGMSAGFKSSLDLPKTMSWKDSSHHGSSRSGYGSGLALGGGYGSGAGYGAGAGAGGGAVGVFPSAHVGGCAIPLLLSCSPSVVAGSLAKAHSSYAAPSYAAPSYRASENINTHSKRDITNISIPHKVKRTPIKNLKPKSILITDKLL